jgi:hypothetical protein
MISVHNGNNLEWAFCVFSYEQIHSALLSLVANIAIYYILMNVFEIHGSNSCLDLMAAG